ncbi:MAG: hypothetical protein AAB336_00685 [Acidobacteriota bacterium]
MNTCKSKHKSNFKRIFVRCVAFLFIVYALAGISILQDYFGNETIGIPPAHHFARGNSDSLEDTKNSFQHSNDQSDSQHHYDHEHLSFCSPNILFEVFIFDYSPLVYSEISAQKTISYENKHSNFDLKNLFRPPQIA